MIPSPETMQNIECVDGMPVLPAEMLREICAFLSPSDRLSAALTCKKWLVATACDLPKANAVSVSIGSCKCRIGTTKGGDLWIEICQCEDHGSTTVLSWILPMVGQGANSLCIEDELLRGDGVHDDSVHTLLKECAHAHLKKVHFSKVDFANVRPWTLALLANCRELEEIQFDCCSLPIDPQNESILIRAISPSFDTLTVIHVKECEQITDKLARSVARNCKMIVDFSVQGCKNVSSLSVLSLIEAAPRRLPSMLTVNVNGTKFDAQQLDRQMRSPLFLDRDAWRLRAVTVHLGYEKDVVMAESKHSTCVLIYI